MIAKGPNRESAKHLVSPSCALYREGIEHFLPRKYSTTICR